MPLDTQTVGANQREILVVGDPNAASNLMAVIALGDAASLAAYAAALAGAVPLLLNSGGTYDRQRGAVGAIGVPAVNTEGTKTTYSNGALGFTPAATPTDFWQILGSGTKTVRVLRITLSGISTGGATVSTQIIKRSTASTGGTPSAQTTVSHDSNDASATAVVNTFGANPSPLGTSLGTCRAQNLNLGVAGSAGEIVWDFTVRNGKGLVLRGAAQSLNLNWNGAAVPAGTVLTIDVEFSEE